jgi:subtilisin family serine protease
VVVAAEGNFADDLDHLSQDVQSPDTSTPVVHDITNACKVMPVEVPGVIGVSATGPQHRKSFYSSYGMSSGDVAAPGGDSRATTADAPNGRVLSTWPAADMAGCLRPVVDASGTTYCYQQGTSMASPHVAGPAALVMSAHPGINARAVESRIERTATPLACPDTTDILYATFHSQNDGSPQTCKGGPGHTSFYGAGEVNALAAVQ